MKTKRAKEQKNKFVGLFFRRIYGAPICLRFYLTFSRIQKAKPNSLGILTWFDTFWWRGTDGGCRHCRHRRRLRHHQRRRRHGVGSGGGRGGRGGRRGLNFEAVAIPTTTVISIGRYTGFFSIILGICRSSFYSFYTAIFHWNQRLKLLFWGWDWGWRGWLRRRLCGLWCTL